VQKGEHETCQPALAIVMSAVGSSAYTGGSFCSIKALRLTRGSFAGEVRGLLFSPAANRADAT